MLWKYRSPLLMFNFVKKPFTHDLRDDCGYRDKGLVFARQVSYGALPKHITILRRLVSLQCFAQVCSCISKLLSCGRLGP
jgi:hypothetical protein